jgi:hypothetical protein
VSPSTGLRKILHFVSLNVFDEEQSDFLVKLIGLCAMLLRIVFDLLRIMLIWGQISKNLTLGRIPGHMNLAHCILIASAKKSFKKTRNGCTMSVCLSVPLSACKLMLMRFDIGKFYNNLSRRSSFNIIRTSWTLEAHVFLYTSWAQLVKCLSERKCFQTKVEKDETQYNRLSYDCFSYVWAKQSSG